LTISVFHRNSMPRHAIFDADLPPAIPQPRRKPSLGTLLLRCGLNVLGALQPRSVTVAVWTRFRTTRRACSGALSLWRALAGGGNGRTTAGHSAKAAQRCQSTAVLLRYADAPGEWLDGRGASARSCPGAGRQKKQLSVKPPGRGTGTCAYPPCRSPTGRPRDTGRWA